MEGNDLQAVLEQMQALAAQMEELTRTTVFWMVISVLLLLFLFVILLLLLRIRRRNRLLEGWLQKELGQVGDGMQGLRRQMAGFSRKQPQAHKPATAQPPAQESRRETPPPRERPDDLIAMINEMLAGDQPYNFVEAIQAMEPGIAVQRLTPRQKTDAFSAKTILEPGGDGLFAWVQGDMAQLYPNYGRFSATLDPTPFFSGARPGGRIRAVLEPARLEKTPEGAWLLASKGRVQM